MCEIMISGGKKLSGQVNISGAKNAVLPILAASLLTNDEVIIKNVPDLEDVRTMIEILHSLSIDCEFEGSVIRIQAHEKAGNSVPYHLIRKMRASFNILGPLSVINSEARVPLPGGCSIGPRPVDLHMMGLKKLGFDNWVEHGVVFSKRREDFDDINDEIIIDLPFPSVGATEQIISTAARLEGKRTVLNNAAKEPEIGQLIDFLNGMGARIRGKGNATIEITGVKELHGIEFSVIPDRMEAGTYLIAGLITNSSIEIDGLIEEHNQSLIDKLKAMNAPFKVKNHVAYTESSNRKMKGTFIRADVYPEFPTDMQPQLTSLLSIAKGYSVIQDTVFPERNSHAEELRRHGADIMVKNQTIVIKGVERLEGAPVYATDLRCSAALVLSGLAAKGETLVQRVDHIFRGYDRIGDKLKRLGADIEIKN